MRKLKLVLLPLLAVVAYMFSGSVLLRLGVDSIVSTLVVDLVVFGLCFVYLRGKPASVRGDGTSVTHARSKYLFWFALALVWLFGQITASWVLSATGDAAFTAYNETLHDTSGIMTAMSLLLTLVAAPLCEEYLIRGVVFGTWSKLNPWFAFFGSALLFSLLHGTVTHLLPTFMMGLLMAAAYASTGKLWFSALLHMGYNAGAAVLGGAAVPSLFFEPWVFFTADALLIALAVLEYRHAMAVSNGKAVSDGETTEEVAEVDG